MRLPVRIAAKARSAETSFGPRSTALSCAPVEDRVICRNPERLIVNLVDGSPVGHPKPAWPGREPFERPRFRNVLIFNQSVFIPLVVDNFELIYLATLSDLHRLLRNA